MKNICVFLSANEVAEKYTRPARKLARLLAKNGFNFIWGGSDRGLMKVAADEVQKRGGKIIGITMKLIKDTCKKDADEMIVAKDLRERKKLMLEKSDAFVALVGGIGTIDEVTELLELKKHRTHEKPIIFLNTDNFYSGLKQQLKKMEKEGFLPRKLSELAYFANNPEEVIDKLS